MIASNPNSICEQARPYYYGYLCKEGQVHIPPEILAHISQCYSCKAEVDRLRAILTETEKHAAEIPGQNTSVITTNLRLHFAYIGVSVNCSTVRPFLPSLADPALGVGIPTPITVHLDKCQKCAKDLEAIRQLALSHIQLCRLGQIFAEEPANDAVSCSQGRAAILAFVTMAFHETNAEVLKHLCICPDCRKLSYQYRETVRSELLQEQRDKEKFPCESVLATDIFDYCFPYGIDPANDQYAKFRPSFTLHARACPRCLGKMQQLHSTICGILDCQESRIVTCFKLRDYDRDLAVSSPDSIYEGWPISVEVLNESKSEPEPDIITVPQKLQHKVSTISLRRFRIPAAAAIILVAVGLFFFSTPVAKAVDLGQIYNALGRIKNVLITTFVSGESEPAQDVWISRALNIKMLKTKTEWVLWDIEGKSRKVKDLNTGSITMSELDEDMLVKITEAIEKPVGLMPFDKISEVPKDAKWQRVADEIIETTIPNTQVYDLTWSKEVLDGSVVYRKWRGYIDTETRLPKRVEQWLKYTEEEYELLTVMKVAYPATVEVQATLSNIGF